MLAAVATLARRPARRDLRGTRVEAIHDPLKIAAAWALSRRAN
jgi:hypothetical protein